MCCLPLRRIAFCFCVREGGIGDGKGIVYGGVVLVLIGHGEAWDLLEWCDGCVCLVCVAYCVGVLTRVRRRRLAVPCRLLDLNQITSIDADVFNSLAALQTL